MEHITGEYGVLAAEPKSATDLNNLMDLGLVALATEGCREAFDQLVLRHYMRVLRIACSGYPLDSACPYR